MTEKIYKYTSLKSGFAILKNRSLILNNPANFNDPFDCILIQEKNDDDKCLKLMKDFSLMKILFKYSEDKTKKGLFKCDYKEFTNCLRKEIQAYKLLLENHQYYEGTPLFSDIYDYISENNFELKKRQNILISKWKDLLKKSYDDIKSYARISCFSKRNNSILMWSHYADSHRGVCFEYDRPNLEEFRDVNYQNKLPEFKIYKILTHLMALDLLEKKDNKQYNKDDCIDILNSFFIKSIEWSYEEEVRCLFSTKEIKDPIEYDSKGNLVIKMELPTAIYIGSRALGNDLDRLLILAENLHIPVYFMKQAEDRFEIVIDEGKKPPENLKIEKNNITLLRLIDEINICINNGAYLSAFFVSLVIPVICSKVESINGTDKDKYIYWCNTFCDCCQKDPNGMSYLSGEVCWNLKNKIYTECNTNVYGQYDDFILNNLILVFQERKKLDLYNDICSKDCIKQNILRFCTSIIEQAKRCYKKHKIKIERLEQIKIEDLEDYFRC